MMEQLTLLPLYLSAHLQLTLFAILVGAAFSVPLGVLVTRRRWIGQPVLGIASVIQTIPSLALLALMVPVLAAMGFQSIGFLPAFIGLVLYSILPILRNTVVAMARVDPDLIEAAKGVGMTPWQSLHRVEFPLALPVILAGVRTATVLTVGVATLSTPVGAPSLGNYIFGGLQTRNYTAVLVGCVAAAVLALLLDGLVWTLGAAILRRHRKATVAILAGIGLLYGYIAVSFVGEMGNRKGRFVVGAKTFTEQYILSQILSQHLEAETGSPVTIAESLGSTVAYDALRTNQIDVYVEYSGTIWATIMQRDTAPDSRPNVLDEVKRFLIGRHGVELVGTLGFENAYALAMLRTDAERLGIRRISDLVRRAPSMTIGSDYEFFSRREWSTIQDVYGLTFQRERSMDASLMYQAIASGGVDILSAFSTDGRIVSFDLSVLEDERGAIPPYDAVILVSPRMSREYPEAVDALRDLIGTIDADRMRRMNLTVDADGTSPAEVAATFLETLREP